MVYIDRRERNQNTNTKNSGEKKYSCRKKVKQKEKENTFFGMFIYFGDSLVRWSPKTICDFHRLNKNKKKEKRKKRKICGKKAFFVLLVS